MNSDFSILFLSDKKTLCNELAKFLKAKKISHTLYFVDNIQQLQVYKEKLLSCKLILCDFSRTFDLIEGASYFLDEAPVFVPVLALKNGFEFSQELRGLPGYQRLSGIVQFNKDWNCAWEEIEKLHRSWLSPVMNSRIEDVSPSDVLQMVGVSQWTSIVRLEGKSNLVGKKDPPRIRGCISFIKGSPESAWSTHYVGSEAIWELLSLTEGTLEVIQNAWSCDVKNVHSRIDEILLTFAVGFDEAQDNVFIDTPKEDDAENLSLIPPDDAALQKPKQAPLPIFEKAQWTFPAKPAVIDAWWNRTAPSMIKALERSAPGSFPLRSMDTREIERIAASGEGARFLVFLGDQKRLSAMLQLVARNFEPKKLVDKEHPTIRLGKFETSCLYITGMLSLEGLPSVLYQNPFIVWTDEKLHAATLSGLDKIHCPAALFFSDDPLMHQDDMAKTIPVNSVSYCVLPEPQEEWLQTMNVFKLIFKALADLTREAGNR